jgi:hypothetical protein
LYSGCFVEFLDKIGDCRRRTRIWWQIHENIFINCNTIILNCLQYKYYKIRVEILLWKRSSLSRGIDVSLALVFVNSQWKIIMLLYVVTSSDTSESYTNTFYQWNWSWGFSQFTI